MFDDTENRLVKWNVRVVAAAAVDDDDDNDDNWNSVVVNSPEHR